MEFDDTQGRIELPATLCLLTDGIASLRVKLEMENADDPARMEQVAADLQRFGFKERLVFDWQRF